MTPDEWAAQFDERHGVGEYARLCSLLDQPRHTFSSIGVRYGVSRERVRQWHRLLRPGAPTGRERRRLHQRRINWRDLMHDDLFRAFWEHARQHVPGERIRPVRTTHGFSRARALLGSRVVVLRRATPARRKDRSSLAFRITMPAAPVELVFALLPDRTFFLLPRHVLPRRGTVFQNTDSSRYLRFRNTFAALHLARLGGTDVSNPAATGRSSPLVRPEGDKWHS